MSEPGDAAPTPAPKPKPSRRAGLVGPLFGWELIRLARRGQDFRARFLLAGGLLVVLTLFTMIWFRSTDPIELFTGTSPVQSIRESARYGEFFTLAFLMAQLAVLMLLTPAYAAGSISEEKERKTFIYLIISELSNHEIVFGKFLGRLVFLLGVLLAGMPVLALTQVYGGTSEKFLFMGYLITACTVIMLAAVSACSALASDTYRGALFKSYGFAALHGLMGGFYPFFSPFVYIPFLWNIEAGSETTFWIFGLLYCAVELGIALAAVGLSVYWVRRMRAQPVRGKPLKRKRKEDDAKRREAERTPAEGPAEPPLEMQPAAVLVLGQAHRVESSEPVPQAVLVQAAPAVAPAPAPPKKKKYPRPKAPEPRTFEEPTPVPKRPRVWADDPFLWKETYTTGAKRTADDDNIRGVGIAVGVSLAIIVFFALGITLLTMLGSGFSQGSLQAGYRMIVALGLFSYFTYLLVVGSSTAGSIVKERQRLTLESLLTIPVSTTEILWPKWRIAITKGWWWGLPTALFIPFGLLLSPNPMTAIPATFLVAGGIPLVASFGLWLSMRCKTMTRAVLWSLPLIGAVSLAPVIINWTCYELPMLNVGLMCAAAGLTWLGAGLFWLLVVRDFKPESQLA